MTEQEEAISQNLKDAGCSADIISQFLDLQKEKRMSEGFQILSKQRCCLLDTIHAEQKKLDTLDYLIFMLKKRTEVKYEK